MVPSGDILDIVTLLLLLCTPNIPREIRKKTAIVISCIVQKVQPELILTQIFLPLQDWKNKYY